MGKVKITVTDYPMVYALQNGAELDYGNKRAKCFDAKCPDEGRVCVHGEALERWNDNYGKQCRRADSALGVDTR